MKIGLLGVVVALAVAPLSAHGQARGEIAGPNAVKMYDRQAADLSAKYAEFCVKIGSTILEQSPSRLRCSTKFTSVGERLSAMLLLPRPQYRRGEMEDVNVYVFVQSGADTIIQFSRKVEANLLNGERVSEDLGPFTPAQLRSMTGI